ncbi:hypothetical protein HCN44_004769 [Aphidius gifuensis]|uniref:DNA topoisomerase n=1 Tax=Aphidius gifuensis TaxID=684658 RepID=A0A834XKK2_APHGI|nr:hypothetical protein HCN44_004769 [Aphidius gifuensis]
MWSNYKEQLLPLSKKKKEPNENNIYQFYIELENKKCDMIMLSVNGHLCEFEFQHNYNSWRSCTPLELFDLPVIKKYTEKNKLTKIQIEKEVKDCDGLIIWTDSDKQGENIGYEIINLCKAVKPNIKVYRAHFLEITNESINNAIHSLKHPQENKSKAIDVLREIDLRIGAVFTRFQTLHFQKRFPQQIKDKVTYGNIQYPIIGFIVNKYLEIGKFEIQKYWKIILYHENDEFHHIQNDFFQVKQCQKYFNIIKESKQYAIVENIIENNIYKSRPTPLNTVELLKLSSKYLNLNSDTTMKIAQQLYVIGLISYPRTDTNSFSSDFDFKKLLISYQSKNIIYSQMAKKNYENNIIKPNNGTKFDYTHTPIYPTSCVTYGALINLPVLELHVYDLIIRHFFACILKDAHAIEKIISVNIGGEKFIIKKFILIKKNFLSVYEKFDDWIIDSETFNKYKIGQKFKPTKIDLIEKQTLPPSLLNEVQLLDLMNEHGIGTKKTYANSMQKVIDNNYAKFKNNKYFIPTKLGLGIVQAYKTINLTNFKTPKLQKDINKYIIYICQGIKTPEQVLK